MTKILSTILIAISLTPVRLNLPLVAINGSEAVSPEGEIYYITGEGLKRGNVLYANVNIYGEILSFNE